MRDNFSKSTKELLAKRVSYNCSNPDCRKPTSGPQSIESGSVNIGVAAHIYAASPGGPRYVATMEIEERKDSSNGIWLCQSCAKLIDSDESKFTAHVLESWKRSAESVAAAALSRPMGSESSAAFAKAERLMPELVREMRDDLKKHPTVREFILMERNWSYNGSGKQIFSYFFDEHDDLKGKCDVLCNLWLIYETTFNNVDRFNFEEEFVDYLENLS